ncbi:MAG: class I SAM-dependent methyltransferase, partial [Owenweeksia sp.]
MNTDILADHCQRIYTIAGADTIDREEVSDQVIRSYYTRSSFFYRKMHSPEGAMHVPVSFGQGIPHLYKLQYQARFVDDLIARHQYTNVLELGFGMGFNTRYLAEKNPNVNFTGIDLTASNVEKARKNCVELPNTSFYQDSFDNPTKTDERYDLIFAVETVCHSEDMVGVLERYGRMLTENGKLVLFDGFRKKAGPPADPDSLIAYNLLLWGFALKQFYSLDAILSSEKLDFLNFEEITEYSENVLPNMQVFQKGA